MIDAVPEYLERPEPQPPEDVQPVGWLMFLPALLGAVLVPKRMGVRLGRSTWTKALVAHCCSVFVVLALVELAIIALETYTWPLFITGMPWPESAPQAVSRGLSVGEWLRVPFALVVTMLYEVTAGKGNIFAVLGGVVGVQALCWLAALFVMPFIAAGERARLLYFRSVKLVLWSTACLVPLAMALTTIVYIRQYKQGVNEPFPYIGDKEAIMGTGVLWSVWWLSVILRLGARYAGPADGPAWQSSRPRCNKCGYTIVGLPLTGQCPECGRDVQRSMPEYRTDPLWTKARGLRSSIEAYYLTARAICFRRDFFETLNIGPSVRRACSFVLWSFGLAGLIVGLTFFCANIDYLLGIYDWRGRVKELTRIATAAVAVFLMCIVVVSAATLLSARLGLRDIRPRLVAVCYCSAMLGPVVSVTIACYWCIYAINRSGWLSGWDPLFELGVIRVDAAVLILLPFALVQTVVLLWPCFRLSRALRDTRFAGV